MALRTALGVGALAASVVVAGCGGRDGGDGRTPDAPAADPVFKPADPAQPIVLPAPPPGTAPPATAGPGTEPIAMVTDLASGWPITLRVGQTMTARMTTDRTAGQRWSLRPGTDGGVVSLAGEPEFEAAPAGPVGTEVFRLTAVKPGQTTLTFDQQKGSDPAVIKSASYPVTVQ